MKNNNKIYFLNAFCIKSINYFLYFWEINLFFLEKKFVMISVLQNVGGSPLRKFLGGKNGKRIFKTYF